MADSDCCKSKVVTMFKTDQSKDEFYICSKCGANLGEKKNDFNTLYTKKRRGKDVC